LKIKKTIQIQIPPGQKKLRIDKYLSSVIENSSRTKIQNAIDEGCIAVNGRIIKSNYLIQPNDFILIEMPGYEEPPDIVAENIKLDIIYEDEYLIIVNKPAGMVTHPAYKNYSGTLVNALLYHVKRSNDVLTELSAVNGIERAGIVHRLDKNTSGILVIAKDEEVHRQLSKMFSRHDIEREYWAVVWGHFKDKTGMVEKPLGRSPKDRKKVIVREDGKYAATMFEVIEEYDLLTLIRLKLKTGRTHQIRAHMNSIGHPVFGDPDYDGRKPHSVNITSNIKQYIKNLLELIDRQALHAKVLGFTHPVTKEYLRFETELPNDMSVLIEHLRKN
jgi:23S rRNA pseudouridine1911/1915/1917 synthase